MTFKDRQAIAGFHDQPDGGKGAAYLWVRKGEEAAQASSFTFEVRTMAAFMSLPSQPVTTSITRISGVPCWFRTVSFMAV